MKINEVEAAVGVTKKNQTRRAGSGGCLREAAG